MLNNPIYFSKLLDRHIDLSRLVELLPPQFPFGHVRGSSDANDYIGFQYRMAGVPEMLSYSRHLGYERAVRIFVPDPKPYLIATEHDERNYHGVYSALDIEQLQFDTEIKGQSSTALKEGRYFHKEHQVHSLRLLSDFDEKIPSGSESVCFFCQKTGDPALTCFYRQSLKDGNDQPIALRRLQIEHDELAHAWTTWKKIEPEIYAIIAKYLGPQTTDDSLYDAGHKEGFDAGHDAGHSEGRRTAPRHYR